MFKKFIALVVTGMLALNCLAFQTFAAPSDVISFDNAYQAMKNMCDFLESKTADERVILFNLVHTYVQRDEGIDALIQLLDEESAGDVNQLVVEFLDSFGIDSKDDLRMILTFVKCLPASDRSAAFDRLKQKQPVSGLTEAEQAAVQSVYEQLIPESARDMLNGHGLTRDVILNSIAAFGNTVKLTSDGEDFVLYSISDEFKQKIESIFLPAYPELDGAAWSTAEELVGAVIETMNTSALIGDSDMKANIRTGLAAASVGIYVAPAGEITALSINTPENLTQYMNSLSNVTFTVTPDPSDADTSDVAWFLNDVKQVTTGNSFAYMPNRRGTYRVYAQAPNGVQSETRVITVLENTSRPVDSGSGGSQGSGSGISDVVVRPTPTPTAPPAEQEAIPTPPPVENSQFSDTQDHWAKDYLAVLSEGGILAGYQDGTFKPDIGITREDMALVLVRMLGLDAKIPAQTGGFSDDAEISDYARNAVYVLSEMGIFLGYDDGTYQPKNIITREEIAVLISRILDGTDRDTISFVDRDQIAGWAQEAVSELLALDIIKGYPDNTFQGSNAVTRAEASVMIYNTMYRMDIL